MYRYMYVSMRLFKLSKQVCNKPKVPNIKLFFFQLQDSLGDIYIYTYIIGLCNYKTGTLFFWFGFWQV